jgi:hypothetical protein
MGDIGRGQGGACGFEERGVEVHEQGAEIVDIAS